jgi:hypothetical protein
MRIDSGLNGSYYQGRVYEADRQTEEAPAAAAAAPVRSSNPVGSSAVASYSLANAFWVVDGGKTADTSGASTATAAGSDWVNEHYLEYSQYA